MATKTPLVLYSGEVKELQSGDDIPLPDSARSSDNFQDQIFDIGLISEIGENWSKIEIGASYEIVHAICHLGGGIVLLGTGNGTGDGDVFRSLDYGKTWSATSFSESCDSVYDFCNLGDGVVLCGTGDTTGKIFKSTDYGNSWSEISSIGTWTSVRSFARLSNGVVLAGTSGSGVAGRVIKSTDNGATWSTMGQLAPNNDYVSSISYLGGDIAIATTGGQSNEGWVYRSTDAGATWSLAYDPTPETHLNINTSIYIGGGIVLVGGYGAADEGDVYRSIDYGVTWSKIDMGATLECINALTYCGSGVVLAGAGYTSGDGDIYKSADYGLTWTKIELSETFEQIETLCYIGSGIVLFGSGTAPGNGDIFRSTLIERYGTALSSLNVLGDVGIGTGSPVGDLNVHKAGGTVEARLSTGVTSAACDLYFNDGTDSGRIRYLHNDDTMQFNTAGAERIRIDSDGLKFNGDTAAANALDDYEEGTFTPTFTNVGTGTYAMQAGTYTKIGDIVHCQIRIGLSAVGTASGDVLVAGLPFTSNNVTNSYGCGPVYVSGVTTGQDNFVAIVEINQSYAGIQYRSTTSYSIYQHSELGTGNIIVNLTYKVA